MSRSIEQALLSLLPTLNGVLPAQLIELASSLLAQSRHRASTLKAEEEGARLLACAHIACDRLKLSLNLPPIESRPPIPPRIYRRLYNHLDKILPAAHSPGHSNAHIERRDVRPSPGKQEVPTRATPSKGSSLGAFRKSSARLDDTSLGIHYSGKASNSKGRDELPVWVRPTLQFVGKEFMNVHIAPTVMAAMQEIVVPHGRLTGDEWARNNLVPLLGALYIYIWMRVSVPQPELDEQRYVQSRKEIVEALKLARASLTIQGRSQSEDEVWDGWHNPTAEDLDPAIRWIKEHGWLESDWAKDIDLYNQRLDANLAGTTHDTAETRIKRPDTMFQDRVDFLCKRRRKEYAAWEREALRRVKELERTKQGRIVSMSS